MQNLVTKDGFDFSFNPLACQSCEGNCCIGDSGYIWINKEEIKLVSDYLKISESSFISDYLKKVGYKYSIKEIKVNQNNFECVFFDKGCSIYPVRPNQCRTYPFWDYFKDNEINLRFECKGII